MGLVLWVISVISNIVGEVLVLGNEGCGGFLYRSTWAIRKGENEGVGLVCEGLGGGGGEERGDKYCLWLYTY